MHLSKLIGRKHIGIGEEELQFRSQVHKTVLLDLVEKLEGAKKIVLLKQKADAGLAAHFCGDGAILSRDTFGRGVRGREGAARSCQGCLPP